MKIPENQNIINSFVSKSEPTTYDHLAKWLIVGTERVERCNVVSLSSDDDTAYITTWDYYSI